MNKEVETELKAKIKQLEMPMKIKCSALYQHLQKVYDAQTICDNANRKIIYDFQQEHGHFLNEIANIAMGTTALTDDMLEGKEEYFSPEELEAGEHKKTAQLDSFYLNVLKKGPGLAESIKPGDEPILKHLTSIQEEVFEDKDDYKLVFNFSENEYFTNETLEVHVTVDPEQGSASEMKSSKIDWKEGKNTCEKTISKKQKNKKTGQSRTVTKTQKCESFFHIFSDRKEDDEDEDEGEDEEQIMPFEQADEILGLIHENVIQYVGASYFGVEIPELEQDNFGDEEDDDYEDDDDEEGDSPGDKKKKGGKSKKEEECKQN